MKKVVLLLCAVSSILYAQDIVSVSGSGERIQFSQFENLDGDVVFTKQDAQKKQSQVSNVIQSAYSPYIAAAALNADGNKLVYVPMMSNQVYVYDLRSQTLEVIDGKHTLAVSNCNEGTFYARMTLGKDGKIYALNNAGTDLVEIDVDAKTITLLGELNNVPELSKDKSNIGDFYGGDMIAKETGEIILISAHAKVYEFSPTTRDLVFKGAITGLPEGYTTNGVAVNQDGEIIMVDSKGKGKYVLDYSSLRAKLLSSESNPSYDLASNHLLPVSNISNEIPAFSLYPTQIEDKNFTINITSQKENTYTVYVYDINAQLVSKTQTTANQKHLVNLVDSAPGLYIVKVEDQNGREIINQKVNVVR